MRRRPIIIVCRIYRGGRADISSTTRMQCLTTSELNACSILQPVAGWEQHVGESIAGDFSSIHCASSLLGCHAAI